MASLQLPVKSPQLPALLFVAIETPISHIGSESVDPLQALYCAAALYHNAHNNKVWFNRCSYFYSSIKGMALCVLLANSMRIFVISSMFPFAGSGIP